MPSKRIRVVRMDKVENFDFLRWLVERGGREGKERGYEKSNFDKLVAEV